MSGEEPIESVGTVIQVLPGALFRVSLASGHVVLARVSGRLRKDFIRISVGDRVNVAMPSGDQNKASIIRRHS